MDRVALLSTVNLARKLRPQKFSQVVGQEISVRMLQNSLYLKKLFPLYIFSGQRGCGKTTSARIFAAALNCEKRPLFETSPKNNEIPCLECNSCTLFYSGKHPDFIELDAASHTGVDTVRELLDSALHLPIMGTLKIYLIDEAHMLSKAAFNAFLKMLEEPPASVLFILATTELQKIPDTVQSRAFHVFFNAIDRAQLSAYLQQMAQVEGFEVEESVFSLIALESEGSARDALNILDQLRLTGNVVSYEAALSFFGRIRERLICDLLSHIIAGNKQALLSFLASISFHQLDPKVVWEMLLQLFRALLWHYNGVDDETTSFALHKHEVAELAQKSSYSATMKLLAYFWEHETLFLQTTHKSMLLETLFLTCMTHNVDPSSKINPEKKEARAYQTPQPRAPEVRVQPEIVQEEKPSQEPQGSSNSSWDLFLKSVEKSGDHFLLSILRQATLKLVEVDKKQITIVFRSYNTFFQNKLDESAALLKPLFRESFEGCDSLVVECSEEGSVQSAPASKPTQNQKPILPPPPQPAPPKKAPFERSGKSFSPKPQAASLPPRVTVDISDSEKWPKATLLVKHFSGKIEKIDEQPA